MKNGTACRLVAAMAMLWAGGSQAQVVISQVYGGGGNSGAVYKSDFIELHNNGSTSVDLTGWSVQYGSATGTGAWTVTTLSGSIAAGGYYLVKEADGTGGTTSLPTPDATGTIAMSGSNGKVLLANTATAFSGACPSGMVDLVGFGTANCAEGTAVAALTNTTAAIRAGEGCTDTGNNSTDFTTGAAAPRNSASSAYSCSGGSTPTLSINDVSLAEGNAGQTAFVFTVSLSAAAPAGGVSVNYATADGTATAGSDYTAASGTLTIPEGSTTATLTVQVNGDTDSEPDETFFVNLSDATGASIGDAQGLGTILNDDIIATAIHDIQGSGQTSPLVGQTVTATGVVTARKGAGFWIQAPDDQADADPATSEGVYVYTGSAPPAAAAVGNLVQVTATAQEYVPSADPYQDPLTELTGATVVQLATGQALPAAIHLAASDLTASGGGAQLERYEGMRVSADVTVVAPTGGYKTESAATSTSDGLFYSVITGNARPFREAGIEAPTPVTGNIPQWDGNPEVLTIDSDTLGGSSTALDVYSGATFTGLTGVLDYSYRHYTLVRDPSATYGFTQGPAPRAAREATANEFTVAGYNMERFYNSTNDSNGGVTLTATAYANRLSKASIAIRDYLHLPDILAVVEMENLATLTDLANKVNSEAASEGLENPQYAPYLIQGNDVGGINVGFLAKSATVGASIARVEVLGVTQEGKAVTWTEPSGTVSLLNDRPPLVLDANVHWSDGRVFPISVIVVHQRSLNGLEDADGRVMAKRQAQSVWLANLVQGMQSADSTRRIVMLGDFNAYQFNDGYVDVMGIITGKPSPDDETLVSGDGADLVTPDLTNLGGLLPAAEEYSYTYDGSAQTLDHVVANDALLAAATAFSMDHARLNADSPETARNDPASPARLSDHDPVVAYFELRHKSDLGVAATASPASVSPGTTLTWQASVTNAGPDAASAVGVGFSLNAELAGMQVSAPAGWSCDAAQVDGGMTSIACTGDSLAADASAQFTVTAPSASLASGASVTLAAAVQSDSDDANATNDTASAVVTLLAQDANVAAALAPLATSSGSLTMPFQATLAASGSAATTPSMRFTTSASGGVARIVVPTGWSCRRDSGASLCSGPSSLAAGSTANFTVYINLRPRNAAQFTLQASAASGNDSDPSDNTVTVTTTYP